MFSLFSKRNYLDMEAGVKDLRKDFKEFPDLKVLNIKQKDPYIIDDGIFQKNPHLFGSKDKILTIRFKQAASFKKMINANGPSANDDLFVRHLLRAVFTFVDREQVQKSPFSFTFHAFIISDAKAFSV
jgi:hypothetical protein